MLSNIGETDIYKTVSSRVPVLVILSCNSASNLTAVLQLQLPEIRNIHLPLTTCFYFQTLDMREYLVIITDNFC